MWKPGLILEVGFNDWGSICVWNHSYMRGFNWVRYDNVHCNLDTWGGFIGVRYAYGNLDTWGGFNGVRYVFEILHTWSGFIDVRYFFVNIHYWGWFIGVRYVSVENLILEVSLLECEYMSVNIHTWGGFIGVRYVSGILHTFKKDGFIEVRYHVSDLGLWS